MMLCCNMRLQLQYLCLCTTLPKKHSCAMHLRNLKGSGSTLKEGLVTACVCMWAMKHPHVSFQSEDVSKRTPFFVEDEDKYGLSRLLQCMQQKFLLTASYNRPLQAAVFRASGKVYISSSNVEGGQGRWVSKEAELPKVRSLSKRLFGTAALGGVLRCCSPFLPVVSLKSCSDASKRGARAFSPVQAGWRTVSDTTDQLGEGAQSQIQMYS
eukprot:1152077-Pelagomonas_calceolata.AAC.3